MAAKSTRNVIQWFLIGFILGYVLALVQRPRQAFRAPLSDILQDTADTIADLRRSKQDAKG